MMTKEYCQRIQIAVMAIHDAETPPLPKEEVSKHLESCADCRLVIGEQQQATEILSGRSRQVFANDVWPEVAATLRQMKRRSAQPAQVPAFIALSLFLLIFKIIEVLPSVSAGVAVKLIPVGVLVLFFALLRQNPFEINPNLGRPQASLRLQGDTR